MICILIIASTLNVDTWISTTNQLNLKYQPKYCKRTCKAYTNFQEDLQVLIKSRGMWESTVCWPERKTL